MAKHPKILSKRLWMIILLLTAFVENGCGNGSAGISTMDSAAPVSDSLLETATPEVELQFETIDKAELSWTGKYYEEKEPGLFILARIDDIHFVERYVSEKALSELQNQNFAKVFVIAVFQGEKPTDENSVEIKRVTRRGDKITIYTQFTTPKPHTVAADMITSPYHLIKIQKDSMKGDYRFSVVVDGKEIIQQTRSFP